MANLAPDPTTLASPGQGQLSGVDLLRAAAELMQQFEDEENEPQFEAEVAKFIAGIKGVIAKLQGLEDGALGVTPQTQYLRRQNAAPAQ